jgi:hypothetical protein
VQVTQRAAQVVAVAVLVVVAVASQLIPVQAPDRVVVAVEIMGGPMAAETVEWVRLIVSQTLLGPAVVVRSLEFREPKQEDQIPLFPQNRADQAARAVSLMVRVLEVVADQPRAWLLHPPIMEVVFLVLMRSMLHRREAASVALAAMALVPTIPMVLVAAVAVATAVVQGMGPAVAAVDCMVLGVLVALSVVEAAPQAVARAALADSVQVAAAAPLVVLTRTASVDQEDQQQESLQEAEEALDLEEPSSFNRVAF